MSVSIYTVQVIIPYETFGEIKSFTSLDEAREFFNTIIKVQTWKCTVYLKGPIKLPGDPTDGPTIECKSVDPDAVRKLRKEIAEMQERLRQMENE